MKVLVWLSAAALLLGGLGLVFVLVAAATDDTAASHGFPAKGSAGAADYASKKAVRIREKGLPRAQSPEEKHRPDLSKAESDDEVNMTAEYRQILAELQSALDADDWQRTVKLVQKMQDSQLWPDGIPLSLHKAAIDSLKWFGSRAAPELVGYLASSDAEVVESAMDAMMETLGDFSLSDHERSALMLGYMKVIKDVDTLDMMMFEIDNMRPTVKAETALGIYNSGNEAAIGVLKENLDFFFCDAEGYEVKGPDGIRRYLADAQRAYREDPDLAATDEDFYGGEK